MPALTLDHLLVYGDLDLLLGGVTAVLGVRPDDGGIHVGGGTRNAIFAAVGERAFELIGPDPAQGAPPHWAPPSPPSGGVLWSWAARTDASIDETRSWLRAEGVETAAPELGTRVRPGGDRLTWTLVDPIGHGFGVAMPFVIRWDEGTPPWRLVVDPSCEIRDFRVRHPEAAELGALFERLRLEVPVERADAPGLFAELAGPAGSMRFASG